VFERRNIRATFQLSMGDSMSYLPMNTASISALRKQAGPGAVACGMWLRVAFIGASAFAVGLIQLVDGSVRPVSALALTAAGAALAAFSTRRARRVLDVDEGAAKAVKAAAVLPANAFAS
jgi:hypothetical protein